MGKTSIGDIAKYGILALVLLFGLKMVGGVKGLTGLFGGLLGTTAPTDLTAPIGMTQPAIAEATRLEAEVAPLGSAELQYAYDVSVIEKERSPFEPILQYFSWVPGLETTAEKMTAVEQLYLQRKIDEAQAQKVNTSVGQTSQINMTKLANGYTPLQVTDVTQAVRSIVQAEKPHLTPLGQQLVTNITVGQLGKAEGEQRLVGKTLQFMGL